jgi:transglutaminase-like putative cysteine protease
MNRRDFMQSAGVLAAGIAFPGLSKSIAEAASDREDSWRTFDVTTRVEVLNPAGAARVWLPTALLIPTPYQKTIWNHFKAPGASTRLYRPGRDTLGIVAADFPADTPAALTMQSRVATRNCAADFATTGKAPKANAAELAHFLRPTKLLPTDGIVKSTAMGITAGAKTDLDKARAIYEWIVENTFRDPKTRGCGVGDIRFMLESRDLGGKCADLNALYVGLARSVGLPARDVYGIRVASSQLGYRSLGASSPDITKAQHCRAEVYLQQYGWVAVDPADVRNVVLEEPPGNRPLNDDMVQRARQRLFGSWEMNWIAFNFSHDVTLPGSSGPALGFLMYPQAETCDGRLDCLDAANFKYVITAHEVTV